MGARRPPPPDHEERKAKALELATEQFNRGEFFECHETLEEVWIYEHGSDRLFLQGLIQAAAAYYALHRRKWGGGQRLLAMAILKLEAYLPEHHGVKLIPLLNTLQRHRIVALQLVTEGASEWSDERRPRIERST